ncbi:MAG TPA: polysaccharide biosynthesis tyrosine autokinase [Tepidisphaeraceae bacterium]|nr:polysaccharide biosynthesis tyrosine autokinase [Tepidisphaeraceae bacterium]
MTSLPQTAPIRLPRPSGQFPGQQHIAMPAHLNGAANSPHLAVGGPQLTPADIWRVIRSNLWLIILSLVLFGLGGYAVNNYVLRPHYSRYTSTGLARVHTNSEVASFLNPGIVGDPIGAQLEQELQTQANMLRHEQLLIDELNDPISKVRETTWWREFGNNVEKAKEDLFEHFKVTPISESRLLAVSMEYRVPEDCKKIVEAIVSRHIALEQVRKTNEFREKVKPTQERVGQINYELERVRRAVNQKALDMGDSAGGGTTAKEFELNQLYAQRIELNRTVSEAQQKLTNLQELHQTGQDPPGLEEKLATHATYNSHRQTIDRIEADLLTSGLSPGHHLAAGKKANIELYQQKMDDIRAQVSENLFASLAAEHRAEIASAEKLLNDYKAQIEQAEALVKRAKADQQELANMRSELESLSRSWEQANDALSKLNAVVSQGDVKPIAWAALPQIPDIPSFPKLSVTLTLALLLGLALSLGIAFVRELTDTTVRSPRDLARVGQLNLLGVIPHEADDPQAAGARLPLVIFDAPNSMLAEQFRQVRSRLQHAASLDTTRSMLVTSPGPGDGKTTVAVNVAAGLALNGRRILLVDANFRRPALHEVFDLGNESGFSDVLNSLENFEHCVRESQVPNLSVLVSGQRPSNPTELLESQLLIDFIERALEEYDHVIFDTGPLPLVSETIALAPRVDGVVTVVKARSNSRGLLQRVRDTLRQVKAEHVGVVLNAVRAQAGGYYGRNILDYYKYQNGSLAAAAGVNGNGSVNGNGRH